MKYDIMQSSYSIASVRVEGLPQGIDPAVAASFRSKVGMLTAELARSQRLGPLSIEVISHDGPAGKGGHAAHDDEEIPIEIRARKYVARPPSHSFDTLIVPRPVRDELLVAAALPRIMATVFDTWGLRAIEPFPRCVLNFFGPAGTGKTMGAHALAQRMGVPILEANYGQIESKFLGSGPRNLEALFFAAERDGAVLFLDEADSLLSARIADASTGAEKASNSLRSQLLTCLERFRGIAVFATNFLEAYDRAFLSRVQNVRFALPDLEARRAIWRVHLPASLPLDEGTSMEELALASEGASGRDIKNAVLAAAKRAAFTGEIPLSKVDLLAGLEQVKRDRPSILSEGPAKRADSLRPCSNA